MGGGGRREAPPSSGGRVRARRGTYSRSLSLSSLLWVRGWVSGWVDHLVVGWVGGWVGGWFSYLLAQQPISHLDID